MPTTRTSTGFIYPLLRRVIPRLARVSGEQFWHWKGRPDTLPEGPPWVRRYWFLTTWTWSKNPVHCISTPRGIVMEREFHFLRFTVKRGQWQCWTVEHRVENGDELFEHLVAWGDLHTIPKSVTLGKCFVVIDPYWREHLHRLCWMSYTPSWATPREARSAP